MQPYPFWLMAEAHSVIVAAKNEISESTTACSNAELTIKHSQAELKKRKADMTKASADYEKDKAKLDNMLKQVTQHVANILSCIILCIIVLFIKWPNSF